MGLGQSLTIWKHYFKGDRKRKRMEVDGFPLQEVRMSVLYWRRNHWVHHFMCKLNPEANECREIRLLPEDLERLANALELWITDPDALPPIPEELRRQGFGVQENNKFYEKVRDECRREAKDEAAKIRKTLKWIRKKEVGATTTAAKLDEIRGACYQASY